MSIFIADMRFLLAELEPTDVFYCLLTELEPTDVLYCDFPDMALISTLLIIDEDGINF